MKGIEPDPQTTLTVYEGLKAIDRTCCNACAVHAEAVRVGAYPAEFLDELVDLGIDPLRPVEVWGVPESGFINGWFLFVGRVPKEWAGDGATAYESLGEGFRFWATGQLTMAPPPGLDGLPLAEVEFVWQDSEVLKRLNDVVWPDDKKARSV